jgi:hypothetical protein
LGKPLRPLSVTDAPIDSWRRKIVHSSGRIRFLSMRRERECYL